MFEGKRRDVSAGADYDPLEKLHFASRAVTFYETMHFWLDETSGEWRQYDVPLHAEIEHWNGWFFVTPREDWEVGDTRHASGTLLVIRRDAFLAGARDFIVLFEPSGRSVLADIDFTKHWLIASQMDDGEPRIVLWKPPAEENASWQKRDFALPAASQSYLDSIDSERDDTVLIHVEHFLSPPSLYFADLANDEPWTLLAQLPAQFDATGLAAVRRHARAPDGVEIPYWLIGRDANLAGAPAPCLLYGYGGFEVALDPHYDATTGMAWLEDGGLLAIANIRGGGEFGPLWHQAAQREKRQVSFDDFIAVAESLIDSGVTTPKQLAIRGGSNGGLLTGVSMIQRPELFGAVLSEVPLLDMARFHLLLQGASWIDEYGDPDDADDLRFPDDLFALSERKGRSGLSAGAFHVVDDRRPRASRPRPQDDGADADAGPRPDVVSGESRRRPRRGRRAGSGGARRGDGVHVPEADDRFGGLRLAAGRDGMAFGSFPIRLRG